MDPIEAFLQANGLSTPTFPPSSRYHGIATSQTTAPDGTVIRFVRRRFIPSPDNFSTLSEHQVVGGDRVDNLAARYLGDPERYWQLCDANGAMDPAELTARPGERIRITGPEGAPGAEDAD